MKRGGAEGLIFGKAENQPLCTTNIIKAFVIANVVKQSLTFIRTPVLINFALIQ